MRFATICTLLSLFAAPLAIIAAPAPAAVANPEAEANPEAHFGGGYSGGRHHFGGGGDDDDHRPAIVGSPGFDGDDGGVNPFGGQGGTTSLNRPTSVGGGTSVRPTATTARTTAAVRATTTGSSTRTTATVT
ncbi:MAG: hypothetical protein L6R40_003753 [Gallowayella cf. fulva]|nr:MAG: hypothetical protein L6R40_003753 [Xanthomendoza cf. fulva]